MQTVAPLSRDLVLVGGGHAHALALRMLAMRPIDGLRITLVSPASHTPYSGMLPGLVAGHYSFEQAHIDLSRLCQWAGVRFIAGAVSGLDPQSRSLQIPGRTPLRYDLLSLDIGSSPELASVAGAAEHAIAVKPVAGLWQRWQRLLQKLEQEPQREFRIAVVGGGAGSVELALAMAHSLRGKPVTLQLYCGADDILAGYNRGARRAVRAALAAARIALNLEARAVAVEPDRLQLADGRSEPFDELMWCTAAAPASWIAASGLAVDDAGFLAVRDTLQSLDDDRVFGCGDIATQVRNPRPKAGVYAVRQGPVLAHNIRNLLLGRPLRNHRPQQRFLSLVSLGERRATADRGPFNATGEWVWRWKDRIDGRFMARFEELPEDMPPALDSLVANNEVPQPHCGGCGAKVGADSLSRVLRRLADAFPDHCRPQDLGDDTSALPDTGGQLLLQSVDLLRQLVSDPWVMGRIAAIHALSDLYASGARPATALAVVTLPFATEPLLQRELEQLLAGAMSEFAAVECRLTGGHTMQGPELSIGFVVNGVLESQPLPKTGLREGDKLVLSKPLGTGTLFARHMQLQADGRDIHGAIDTMLRSNDSASQVARQYRASAVTDVTGFGLAGHLLEMLEPGQLARLDAASLPALPGALSSLRAGCFSTMHEANSAPKAAMDIAANVEPARLELLFDPQTSGGLLMGIEAEHADRLCSELRRTGDSQATVVGEVVSAEIGEPPALAAV